MKEKVLDRFLRYIAIDTQSDENSETFPSTAKQKDLGKLLVDELVKLGLSNVQMDKFGYVTATLPSNSDKKDIPTIAFIAHMDTSPDMSGKDVKAQIHKDYDGEDIILNKAENVVLSTKDFPELKHYVGQTLITTDGTTLLGADDKAGIAEIFTAIEYLIENPDIKHGEIKIAFTPDEEVGRGVDHFDVEKFNADFAYTLDGGEIGELEYENFNAAQAKITIQGRNIHPGYAKDKMINAILVAMELNSLLPVNQRPEFTTSYDGFYHPYQLEGTVEKASITYIIRDHDKGKFEEKKQFIKDCAELLNKRYGDGTVNIELKDQYYNMKEKVEPVFHLIEKAEEAMLELNIEPKIIPIRGGTDGARLSFMGLPCPNLFTGGHNFHGKYEYIPLESMEKACQVILKIIEKYSIV